MSHLLLSISPERPDLSEDDANENNEFLKEQKNDSCNKIK
jgi:hypothetical protein